MASDQRAALQKNIADDFKCHLEFELIAQKRCERSCPGQVHAFFSLSFRALRLRSGQAASRNPVELRAIPPRDPSTSLRMTACSLAPEPAVLFLASETRPGTGRPIRHRVRPGHPDRWLRASAESENIRSREPEYPN